MSLDISALGKQSGTVKVSSIEDKGTKMVWLACDQDGQRLPFPVKVWKGDLAKMAVVPAPGVEAAAEIDVKAGQYGNEALLLSFGGSPRQGGGGGRQFVPRSAAEIHSASVAGIVKSCIEKVENPSELGEWALAAMECYADAMGRFKE